MSGAYSVLKSLPVHTTGTRGMSSGARRNLL